MSCIRKMLENKRRSWNNYILRNKMKLIYLEWEDASSQNGWHSRQDVKEFSEKSTIIKQVGWCFEETRRYIILVSRYAPDGIFTEDDDSSYAHLQKVPKTWIRKRIDLTKYIK